ncbi:hypothetical protein OG762_36765 [Streptomyces sp. NBC_01136]|uniref:hypothetical protein n=1 Tax=Streptomyces sp. NBC_01136 TaxID=2903754 RepID=UPI00386CAC3D|nr:hypothetical protein OG762_36765 [Streptomyces sp. NBC_01136]
MTFEQARLAAAQAKADELIAAIAETLDGAPLLRVAVTDPETNTRLATGFVTYQTDGAPLRLVTS